MLAERSVLLDAQGAQNRGHQDRGISRYTVEHVAALLQLAPEVVHSVAINPQLPLPGKLDVLFGTGLLEWSVEGRRPTGAAPTIYHVMSPFELERPLEELWPRWARSASVRTVVTLYDLIPLIFADHYLATPDIRTAYLARLNFLRSADHVLAISQTTATDAIEHVGIDERRITIVDAGVSDRFAAAYGGADAARRLLRDRLPDVRDGYLLYVAGIEFRKNVERVIEGYSLIPTGIRTQHQMVIACRVLPEERARLARLATEYGLRPDELILTGYVSDAELAALYHLCHLFVFASLYEGSGLPILEAMACGAPVAASRTSTSPEILGDLEATFDPYSPPDIARVLAQTVKDGHLLERLRARSSKRVSSYTWRNVAERSLEAYEAAIARVRPSRRVARARSARPRIAWYSPWPPERSGIASYSRRLLQSLGRHADVDVVVAEPMQRYARPEEPGVRLVHSENMRWLTDVRLYDRYVYCMGNSSFHRHVYEALLDRHGVALMHDVRLVGFYRWYAQETRPATQHLTLARWIESMYSNRVDAGAFAHEPPSPSEQESLGLFMSQEVQEHAELLLTHSGYAADVLRLDRPPERRAHAPIEVVPFAIDERAAEYDASRRAPVIVSFGHLAQVKGLEVLLDAFAALSLRMPDLRLCLAGPGEDHELERWRESARSLGIDNRVDVPGFVSEAEYESLLQSSILAIQLRMSSNGEASAAVADCLGAGLPTITSALGWTLELPDDAIVRVPRDIAPAVLAEEMDGLIAHPKRRAALSAAARRHARTVSFDEVARRYLEVLELAPS